MQGFRIFLKGSFFFFPVFLAAILVPFLVFPWFLDSYEIHKATLVVFAVAASGTLFFFRALRAPSWGIVWSWSLLFPLFFLLATIASAFVSVAPAVSWMGIGGGDYSSVLFLGACALMVFLFLQIPDHFLLFLRRLRFFWALGALVLFFALLFIFFGILSFSPTLSLGTPHALALFFIVIALCFSGELSQKNTSLPFRVFGYSLLFISFSIAFFLDAWILWLPLFSLGIILFLFLFFGKANAPGEVRIFPAILLLFFPVLGWLLPPLFEGFFPLEITPSLSLSLEIIRGVWGDLWGLVFGSGSGTYGISYALYALPSVNSTAFWYVLFERGFSHIFTLAVTGGLLTVIACIALQISGVVLGFYAWRHASEHDRGNVLGFYLAFLFLVFSAWTYAWNTTIVFLFFVFYSILLSLGSRRFFSLHPQSSSSLPIVKILTLIAAFALFFFMCSFAGTRYVAEIFYARALFLSTHNGRFEDILANVERATVFNRWNDVYYRELSLLLLRHIEDLVAQQVPAERIQETLTAAIDAAVRATDIGPSTVKNWETRGLVYREVAPAVAQAADFSLASFTTATQLAPSNPRYFVELGRSFLVKADVVLPVSQIADEELYAEASVAREEALVHAEEAFLTAIALKSDYVVARYFLSVVYERQGKLADAVKTLEMVRALNAEDVGVGMQLALLYLRQEANNLAKAELERIIALSPTYANARWYLSVLLEQEGDLEGALAQVAEVLKTNPDNETVQRRLERLQNGEVEDDVALPEPLFE